MNTNIKDLDTLDRLSTGSQGVILSFSQDCPDTTKRLLSQYGLTKGCWVMLQFRNPWNDLIAIQLPNALIAIRDTEAKYINVRMY